MSSSGPDEALARRALVGWGITPDELVFLSRSSNIVWRVQTGTRELVLRLSDEPGWARGVSAELEWLDDLSQRGLPVPPPVARPSGERVVEVRHDDGRTYVASVLGHIPGVTFSFPDFVGLTANHAFNAGELTARLHTAAEAFCPSPEFDRPRPDALDVGTPLPLSEIAALVEREFGSGELVTRVSESAARDLSPRLLIHADLHPANLVAGEGADKELAAIDFDDCGIAPAAYDLGVFFAATRLHRPELQAPFLAGYRSQRFVASSHVALYEAVRTTQDLICMATEPENPYFLPHRTETAAAFADSIALRLAEASTLGD